MRSSFFLGDDLAAFILARAGRFLDQAAPLLRFGVDQLVDFSLLDDRIGFAAHAGAEKQIDTSFSRQSVLLIAYSDSPERNSRRVTMISLKLLYSAGLRPSSLSKIMETSAMPVAGQAVAAVKDHVFHLMPAKMAGALLAHGPAQGINDIGLAATIGTDDRRDARIQFDDGPLGEGLKANHFKAF